MHQQTRFTFLGFFVVLLAVLFSACSEVIEKNISGSTLTILAPADSLSTANSSVVFWWEEMDGATAYELQVVSPSFTSVITLPLDTVIAQTKYTGTFVVGQYQWRVRAINNSYKGQFVTRTFEVQ